MFGDFELCQNINYLGEIIHVMCVAVAEFLGKSCLSKPQYAIAWLCYRLALVNLIALFKNNLSDIFLLNGIFSAREEHGY